MPGADFDVHLKTVIIGHADLKRAQAQPGKQFGILRHVLGIAITMEPSTDTDPAYAVFVMSAPNTHMSNRKLLGASMALDSYAMASGSALGGLQHSSPAGYQQAVDFINGPGLEEALGYLQALDPARYQEVLVALKRR